MAFGAEASLPFTEQSSMALRLRFWAAALAALTFRKRLRGFKTVIVVAWATAGRPAEPPPATAVGMWRDVDGADEDDDDGSETADERLVLGLLL